jgi:hypothetical protein
VQLGLQLGLLLSLLLELLLGLTAGLSALDQLLSRLATQLLVFGVVARSSQQHYRTCGWTMSALRVYQPPSSLSLSLSLSLPRPLLSTVRITYSYAHFAQGTAAVIEPVSTLDVTTAVLFWGLPADGRHL